ncbi:MAG TPA: DUF892 family protein [Opitutales bacterium]|nr:DUF892 family protein [Opitutales bacterium]
MIQTLQDLLISQAQDLYDAENRVLTLLPRLKSRATDEELKTALGDYLVDTDAQAIRLREICKFLGVPPEGETCEATRGLVREAEELVEKAAAPAVKDTAIIVSTQRIAHYAIASYGSAATYAEILDNSEIADRLKNSIAEEKDADARLKKLASGGLLASGLNEEAAR